MTTLLYIPLLNAIGSPDVFPVLVTLLIIVVFAAVLVSNRIVYRRVRKRMQDADATGAMIQQALKDSTNNVVRFDLRESHVYQLYGHLFPEGGVSSEEWKRHVHPDDLEPTVQRFHQMMAGRVERDEFYYRWNFDYSGASPRWGYMHNVSVVERLPGAKRPVSIISTLRDETELRRQEQEESELTGKYKLIFEHSIIGLSFYNPDGWLLDANKIMREICHFDSEDGDTFFSQTNLFELSPFRECVDRTNIEELWICTESVVPERKMRIFLEIRLHPIHDDQGKLIYIAIATRDVSEERDMYLQSRLNDRQIIAANAQIQRLEEELRYMMESCEMQPWRISLERGCIEFYQGLSVISRSFPLEQLPKLFVSQDDELVRKLAHPATAIDHPLFYIGQMYPVVTGKATGMQWVQINSIPEYDEQGRLKGSFGVWRNITSLMRKQEQLRRETERANDSGRLKSVFLANMTHEIRTPLNAIVGFSDLLQMIEAPEERREMIRVIHNNCDMLLRLINDMLVLSNVDSNAVQIVTREVDFAREFDNSCVSLAKRIESPTVEFRKDNPYASLRLHVDYGRIQQVLTNFVTNAVKYTQQGHIAVGYRMEERDGRQGIRVYCEDTGTGIPADQRERIFERFVKLNDYVQGTGLGLSICKIIIEKCGGVISVDSEEGKGSTFWFWIPAQPVEG